MTSIRLTPLSARAVVVIGILLGSSSCIAASDGRAVKIIETAIDRSGGQESWRQMGTMVVHETQLRHTDQGVEQIQLVHYLDTDAQKYRMEITDKDGHKVYGWDGSVFWATLNGQPGGAELLQEAQRSISSGFYRFNLPFNLNDADAEIEYAGAADADGAETEVVKISYANGPTSRYWRSEEHHGHSAAEIYYYHFNKDNLIVKIHFSHHADDTYEDLLFDNYKSVDGIVKERERTLIGPDGEIMYESKFSEIEFRKTPGEDIYQPPGI